jgi:hypothetical protein
MGDAEKVAVETGETADGDAALSLRDRLNPVLLVAVEVVVPNVRWVADDEVEAGLRLLAGEIG